MEQGGEPMARLLSVNVGRTREFDYNGRPAKSAIWKSPIAGRILARGVNLEGDDQADRKAHGGPDKSVYAYAIEDVRWWEEKLGRSLQYGEFGDNFTTEGVVVNDALVASVGQSAPPYLKYPNHGSLAGGLEFG